ncbi:hypothetical protein D918_09180 [Trichuris suis]|nr:hypothetical protein D918_09180 [Trichuris suis]
METRKLLRRRNCLLDMAYPYKGKVVVVILLWVFFPTIYTLKLSFVEQEEAQYVQALHDILYHGFNLEQYAHFGNADVAPFSFLGPLYFATLTYPALLLNRLAIIGKSEVIMFGE